MARRRRPVLPGLVGPVVVLLSLAGCSAGGPDAPDRESATAGLRLEATLLDEADGVPGLYVEYTVVNDGEVPATVLDRLPAGKLNASTYSVDPRKATVDAYANGVVELSKRSYPTPEGQTLESPWMLQGTRVAPGESLTGEAFTPFPLERVGIGFAIEPVGLDAVPPGADRWRFCIEVGQIGDVEVDPAAEGLPAVWVPNPMDGHLLCSPTEPLPDGWDG